jgi:uncharacterized membrane protein
MQNLYVLGGFVDPVINQDRRMDKLADAGPSIDLAADVGKPRRRSTWFSMALPNFSAVAGKLTEE